MSEFEKSTPDLTEDLVKRVIQVVDKGLTAGEGKPIPGQMCVEAAVAYAFGEPHSDHPKCVSEAVRNVKIGLNDVEGWGTSRTRAAGLRRVAVAQLGSEGVIKASIFYDELDKLIKQRFATDDAVTEAFKTVPTLNLTDTYAVKQFLITVERALNKRAKVNVRDQGVAFAVGQVSGLRGLERNLIAAEITTQALVNLGSPGAKFLYLTNTPEGGFGEPQAGGYKVAAKPEPQTLADLNDLEDEDGEDI